MENMIAYFPEKIKNKNKKKINIDNSISKLSDNEIIMINKASFVFFMTGVFFMMMTILTTTYRI